MLSTSAAKETYDLVYTLHAGEPFVRIEVSGKAPTSQSSVVSASTFAQRGQLPDGLTHGTPYHWNDVEPVRYWYGPTFQATHDYVLPTVGGQAIASVLHGGTPAWCRDQGASLTDPPSTLLGVLFRSADDPSRGAAGTDPDRHTQSFAIGVPGAGLDPTTTAPLQQALAYQTPLAARVVTGAITGPFAPPASAQLAAVTGPGLVRAARTQPGSQSTAINATGVSSGVPTAFVLRLYTPGNQAASLAVSLPWSSKSQPIAASLVTALERPLPKAGLPNPPSSVTTGGTTVTVAAGTALTTLRVATQRRFVPGSNGK